MKLTAEQIQENWDIFISNIENHITGDRKQALLDFYNQVSRTCYVDARGSQERIS